MYKKILIPTDGSEQSNRAAEHAMWIANHSGAEILVLNVFETSSLNPVRSRELRKEMKEMWKTEADETLSGVLKILNSNETNLNVYSQVKEGRPAETILKTIEDENVDFVVMGSSGKHGLDRLLMGSVAEKVVRSANTPVMMIH